MPPAAQTGDRAALTCKEFPHAAPISSNLGLGLWPCGPSWARGSCAWSQVICPHDAGCFCRRRKWRSLLCCPLGLSLIHPHCRVASVLWINPFAYPRTTEGPSCPFPLLVIMNNVVNTHAQVLHKDTCSLSLGSMPGKGRPTGWTARHVKAHLPKKPSGLLDHASLLFFPQEAHSCPGAHVRSEH